MYNELRKRGTGPHHMRAINSGKQEMWMPQTITTGFRALLDAAEREIETLSVEEAAGLHAATT